jgi:hypothetical protein
MPSLSQVEPINQFDLSTDQTEIFSASLRLRKLYEPFRGTWRPRTGDRFAWWVKRQICGATQQTDRFPCGICLPVIHYTCRSLQPQLDFGGRVIEQPANSSLTAFQFLNFG